MSEVWIGRQPIFDRQLATHAYELLFRSPEHATPGEVPGAAATARVIVGALADVGLDRVVGSTRAFVNLTRGYVVGQYPLPLPPERVVLEILEDIVSDEQVVFGVERLRREGFTLALDDFTGLRAANEPLVARVDLVKVECLGRSTDEVAQLLRQLAPYRVQILAEKIETQEQLSAFRVLGFDYFQGYFLEKPSIVKSAALAPQRVQLLQLVGELQSPSLSFERIEAILLSDVALSFKLLNCVNSVAFGLARRIDSVREALVYLGAVNVRNIVCLLLLTRIDDKPRELVATAMTRGRMCELLASALGKVDPRSAFTVGMFSLLDAFLDQPMTKIVATLPLSASLNDALTERAGSLGAILAGTVAFERGVWEEVDAHLGPNAPVRETFLDAVKWVQGLQGAVTGVATA